MAILSMKRDISFATTGARITNHKFKEISSSI
jgi:hypothetical protein